MIFLIQRAVFQKKHQFLFTYSIAQVRIDKGDERTTPRLAVMLSDCKSLISALQLRT
jgi:hypothetical protein